MGNKQASQQKPVKKSPHSESLSRLYEELAEVAEGISTVKKETFQNYFRSQVDDFDELLFSHIASSGRGNRDAVGLTLDEFTDGFETFLDNGGTATGKLQLYFSMFSDGESSMSFTDLVEMFQISRSLALAVTDSDMQGPKPEAETIADVWARSIMGDDSTCVDCNSFCGWAKQNCPRVFDGIHCWVRMMLLHRGHPPGTTSSHRQGFPVIPRLSNPLDNHSLLNMETLWILSTILPPCFLVSAAQTFNLGGPQVTTTDERKAKPQERCKEWMLLYDSVEHGQSLNRCLCLSCILY